MIIYDRNYSSNISEEEKEKLREYGVNKRG